MSNSPKSTTMHEPLVNWRDRIADIPDRGLEMIRDATPDELSALAKSLELPALSRLNVAYRIRPGSGGRYTVRGELSASVTQACIVTLEPVAADIHEAFEEEFWPEDKMPAPNAGGEEDEHEALAVSQPEIIRQGMIEIGSFVYEQLATAIDPYPRAPGAEFAWRDGDEDSNVDKPNNPFASLAALKDET